MSEFDEVIDVGVVSADARLRTHPGDEQRLNVIRSWAVGPTRTGKRDAERDAVMFRAVPDLLALARRVHAECGPVHYRFAERGFYWKCESCRKTTSKQKADIPHPPDCLWLAADAMKKAGII